jgi:hypothetical protein
MRWRRKKINDCDTSKFYNKMGHFQKILTEDYKYKMNLMTDIAAKEQFSGLDAVSELLKDKDIETNELGRRLLEQYGYWEN